MKGFNLSTDYKKLWKLIYDGYRIPAWVLYADKYEDPIYDIVEVRVSKHSREYSIGTRGRGYGSFENTLESFEQVCQSIELKYINPC